MGDGQLVCAAELPSVSMACRGAPAVDALSHRMSWIYALTLERPSSSHFWAVHGRAGARGDHGVAGAGLTRPLDYPGGPGQSVVAWARISARLGRLRHARVRLEINMTLRRDFGIKAIRSVAVTLLNESAHLKLTENESRAAI